MEKELKNLRKKNEKHFLQDDGTIIAKMYRENIHYLKDGIYEEIDNTLIKKGNKIQNKSNEFKASFSENDKNKLLKMERDGHTLSMSFRNELEVSPNVKNTEICYQNLLDKVDVTYKVLSNKVKEAILLKENKYKKLEFVIETDLELSIKDKTIEAKNDNEIIFVIEAPYMMDANNIENHNIYYTLEKHSNHYDVILYLDTEWLEKAKFPVIIDPTITNYKDGGVTYDTYIFEGDKDYPRGHSKKLWLGVHKEDDGTIEKYRALFKFNLPKIGTGSQIIGAEAVMLAWGDPYAKQDIFAVHKISKEWDENTATYKTMWNAYDSRIEAYSMFRTSLHLSNWGPEEYNHIDITNLVKSWYSGEPNNGIMIKSYYEVYDPDINSLLIYSSENDEKATPPCLLIHYRNQNGLESYMDYQTQSFIDGSTSANLYNGNLVSVWNVGKTVSGKFPINLDLIYNTNDIILETNYGYGLGEQLSLHQTLEFETIEEFEKDEKLIMLRYKDGDGTYHYFYKGSDITPTPVEGYEFDVVERNPESYYDEDGLSLVITKDNDNFMMQDNDGNTSYFTKNGDIWYLTEIKDTKESTIKIEYLNNKIVKVIDGNEKEITVTYGTNVITVTSPNETVTLNYENNLLKSIVSKNGTTNITYNNHNIISKITDITGKSIGYEYYDTIPYRVKKISEYGINNTLGNYLELIYGFNTTTVKDHKNRSQTYTFNNNGNTVGITNLDEEENLKEAFGKSMIYGSKDQYTTSFGSVNKLVSENSMIKVVKNYLQNSSFEDDRMFFKEATSRLSRASGGGDLEFLSFDTSEAVTGKRSLFLNGSVSTMIDPTIEQYVKVPKGKTYTFSAYINVFGFSRVILSYLDSNGNTIREGTDIQNTNGFERIEVTIDYAESATSDLKIEFIITDQTHCYIDDVQLEEGEVANLYNLIDNSDFSDGTMNGFNFEYRRIFETPAPEEKPEYGIVTLENNLNALRVTGSPYLSGTIEKTFPVSGKAGDIYTIYFWYKNEGIQNILTSTYNKKVLIRFDYGEIDDPHCLIPRGNFTDNNTTWHLFEESFIAEYDYTSFTLTIFNDCTANNLYLTNFGLYKPIASTGYEYDSNGNVTTVNDPLSGPKELSYDKNNQLVGMLDVKGSNFVYEYDNEIKDRVLKGISATGISNEIEYDEFGNPIITKITNKNTRENIEGIYYIRMKGTKKYFDNNFAANMISLKEDCCSHDGYSFIKEDNYYKIVPVDNPNYAVSHFQERITLSKENYSLFELIKNKNGSYMFKLKQEIDENEEISGVEEAPKIYVTFDSEKLVLDKKEMEKWEQNFYLEEAGNHLFVVNTAEYTEDGKYIKSTKDTLGRTTTYDIDTETGLTKSVIDSKGVSINYTYNSKEQLTKVEKDNKCVEYEYNDKNLLSKIKHGTKEYKFTYDEFLNTKTIGIGNNTLITNNYEANNGNLESSTYGNNDTISYTYDKFDRVKTITKMNDIYRIHYDNLGNVAKIESNNNSYRYQYDLLKRLTNYQYGFFRAKYNYDETSNVKDKYFNSLETAHHIQYEYNKDNAVTKIIFDNNCDSHAIPMSLYASGNDSYNTYYQDELVYTYDELGRMTEKKLNDIYKTNYHFITRGKRTSFVLDKLKDNFNDFEYKYDSLDNITDIYKNGDLINHYEYDNSNQLIKDDDYESGITTIYSYDNVGNIISKKDYRLQTERLLHKDIYEYNNTNWEDQLTKFNDENITYDKIGNPLTIGTKTLTWINGRQLESIVDGNNTITYEYNKDGIRTKKTVNGKETKYLLENNNIIFEESPKGMIYYKRDENNHLIGFRHNYKHYYYIKNAQEDIIGIMDSNYNVIANYKYDAYGNINLITDNKGLEITDLSHVAYINPFRYRSYYYDEDTKLYYLNSRYYNPLFGRFINADGTIAANDDIISHNLFGYVSNNPVNKIDVNGNYADALPFLGAYLGEAAGASASTGTAVGWLVAGGLAIASLLCYGIYELTKPKEATTTATLTDTKVDSVVYKKEEKKIYRGGTSNRALTPRNKDSHTGLSFHSYPNQGSQKYTVTTVEKVNATGVLVALPKLNDLNHYHIIPTGINKKDRNKKMNSWVNSRESADIAPHPYTTILKSISWVETY